MQHFTSQLREGQQTTHSLRVKQYRKNRKHRPESPEHEHSNSTVLDVNAERSHTSFASPLSSQRRVAGLLSDEEDKVPPSPFPHASLLPAQEHKRPLQVPEEIAKPPSRLYSTKDQGGSNSLRATHLNVLTTILHRCLIEADYQRAGRAWGMVLRTQVPGGELVDPRNNGRWGIGAEILLGRHSAQSSVDRQGDLDHSNREANYNLYSAEGFERAREYYERLVIQYPNRKANPHAVDELTFYPAMFSLWIMEVCNNSTQARAALSHPAVTSRSRSPSADSTLHDTGTDHRAREEAIQAEELTRAKEIADRLDLLLSSPPYDKQAGLLQVRGHVSLWISDLVFDDNNEDRDWDMDLGVTCDEGAVDSVERLRMISICRKELHRAKDLLRRAVMAGAIIQQHTMASIDVRLRELDIQATALNSNRNEDV